MYFCIYRTELSTITLGIRSSRITPTVTIFSFIKYTVLPKGNLGLTKYLVDFKLELEPQNIS